MNKQDLHKVLSALSEKYGVTKMEIKRAADRLDTEDYEFAAAYSFSCGLAVNVKGNRHQWNVNRASTMIGRRMQ